MVITALPSHSQVKARRKSLLLLMIFERLQILRKTHPGCNKFNYFALTTHPKTLRIGVLQKGYVAQLVRARHS
jgi:hypothetical protein